MNFKELISSAAFSLIIPFSAQAQVTISLDWQFATGDSPTAPTASVNPLGATAAANIDIGIGTGYSPSSYLNESQNYGSPSGIWNTAGIGSGFQLTLNAGPATPGTQLSYTLQIDQFINTSSFPDAGNLVISPGPAGGATRSTTPLATGNEGGWYQDTYTWQVTRSAGPLTVSINPDPVLGYQDITIDRIQWTVAGDLAAVPEPGWTASAIAGGLALFTLGRLRKREA